MCARGSCRFCLRAWGSLVPPCTPSNPSAQGVISATSVGLWDIYHFNLVFRQTLPVHDTRICRPGLRHAAKPKQGFPDANSGSSYHVFGFSHFAPFGLPRLFHSSPYSNELLRSNDSCIADAGAVGSSSSSINSVGCPGYMASHLQMSRDQDDPAAAPMLTRDLEISSSRAITSQLTEPRPPCNIWLVRCPTIKMETAYPSLSMFAEAVHQQATTWHPVLISTAMNYAVKLKYMVDRQRSSLPNSGSGGGCGGGGDSRSISGTTSMASAAATAASPEGPTDISGVVGGASPHTHNTGTVDVMLQETLLRLYAAFIPHIHNIIDPRFITNALWVCARTGCWTTSSNGDADDFTAALLQRLRDNDGGMLETLDGVGHSILWRALSLYHPHRAAAGKGHGVADKVPTALMTAPPAHDLPEADVPPKEAIRALEVHLKKEDCVPHGPKAGSIAATSRAAGGMDVLQLSASIIKRRLMQELPPDDGRALNLQDLCNVIRAAARLEYSENWEFIDAVLRRIVSHSGPFKPQDISDMMYGLGKLYGTVHDRDCSTTPLVLGECRTVATAVMMTEPSGRLPPKLASYVHALAEKLLQTGLPQLSPQALSNAVHGLALLGLRLERSDDGLLGAQVAAAAGSPGVENSSRLQHWPLVQSSPRASDPQFAYASEGQPSSPQTQTAAQHQIHATAQQPSRPHLQHLQPQPEVLQPQPPLSEDLPPDPNAAACSFVARLGQHVRGRLQNPSDWTWQPLSNATWAFAKVGYMDQSYYEAVVRAAVDGGGMVGARKEAWGQVLWALARSGHQPRRELLLRQLRTAVCGSLYRPSDTPALGTLLWALAALSMYDKHVVSWISRFFRPMALTRRDLAGCLWALAAMPEGSLSRHMQLAAELVEAANHQPFQQYSKAELVQLWHAHLELEAAAANYQQSTTSWAERRDNALGDGDKPAESSGDGQVNAATSSTKSNTPGAGAILGEAVMIPPRALSLQLSPELVEAALEAVLEVQRTNTSRTLLMRAATDWQPAVLRCLRGLMNPNLSSTRLQQHRQQQDREAVEVHECPSHQKSYQEGDAGQKHVAVQGQQQQQQGTLGRWAGEVRWRLLEDASVPVGDANTIAGTVDRSSSNWGSEGRSAHSRYGYSNAIAGGSESGIELKGRVGDETQAAGTTTPTPRIDLMEKISRISEKRAANLQKTVTRCLQQSGAARPRGLCGMADGEAGQRQGRHRWQGTHQQDERGLQQRRDVTKVRKHQPALSEYRAATVDGRTRNKRRGHDASVPLNDDGGMAQPPPKFAVHNVRILDVEEDSFVEPLGLRVCARVRLSNGRQLALELEGPDTCFLNSPHSRLPQAALRLRQLNRVFGLENVKCVSHWQWAQLGGRVQAQRAYLSRLLGL